MEASVEDFHGVPVFSVLTDEQTAQAEIVAMRREQYPADDGMPEH